MPVESKEPLALYIAKSMQQLNERVDLKMEKGTSVKSYCNMAAKVFKAAKEAYVKKDEERAYVLYMKFANLTQQIRKTKGYAADKEYYNSMMGANNIVGAVEKAEELSSSLGKRYSELKEAEEIKARLDQREKEEEEAKNRAKDGALVNGVNGDASEKEPEKEIGENGSITSEELYRLFQAQTKSVLVLDARPTEQFEASHMICEKCANIPTTAIKPGCTVAIIEKGLSPAAKAVFQQRGQVDYIVMLDWECSLRDLTPRSTLSSLKDAIYKWDSTVTLKHEPLVLDGGYDRWILKYPMYSTNPKVPKPPSYNAVAVKKYSSLDFDYPTSLEDEEPEKPPEPKPAPAPQSPPASQGHHNGLVPAAAAAVAGAIAGGAGVAASVAAKPTPVVNRSLKPGAAKPASQAPMPSQNGTGAPRGSSSTQQVLPSPTGSTTSPATTPVASHPKIPTLTGTGDAKPASAAAKPVIPVVNRSVKPQIGKTSSADRIDAKSEVDLPPPTYEDVTESAKEDAAQQNLMQEHKNRENEARLELERMRQKKTKAENEQLRKEKEDVERRLEEKIAALQTLQKQLQEQQAKQDEERRLADEKAKAEEVMKSQDNAGDSAAVAAATAPPAGSKEQPGEDTSKSQPAAPAATSVASAAAASAAAAATSASAAAAAAKPSPTKDAKPSSDKAQPQQKPQQPSPQRQPTQQPKQPVTTATAKTLPPGWEKKLDQKSGRYFYVDHNTGTTHWNPPPLVPAAGESKPTVTAAVPKPRDSSPKVSPQHAVKPESPAHKPSTASTSADSLTTTTKTRLKSASDAEFGTKPGLKRSFSSPNIAKMVLEEDSRPTPAVPTIDRSTKPAERLANIQQQVRPVTVSRMRNLAPVYGSMGQSRTGLKNLGNTCFMNSVVQCLSATTLLSHYFITDKYAQHINRRNPLGRGGEVVEEFAIVIKALWSGQYRSISPRDLRDTVYKYVPEFRKHMGHHHDSQEFLLFLMDELHEDVNQVIKREYIEEPDYAKMLDEEASRISWDNHKRFNRSIIVELFQGQFKSTIKCMTCHHESVKFDVFTFLTLPIPSSGRVQLKDCLSDFSKPEKMTGDNAYHCSRCKTKRNSVKTILLWKLPPVLLICLKRFYHEGMWRQKLQTMVDYPLQDMDMGPFTKGPRVRGLYNLFAVSNHTGTLDGGHYTAYCKNALNRRWYKYDDHEVYDVSTGNIKSSAAYILFYSSIDLPPP